MPEELESVEPEVNFEIDLESEPAPEQASSSLASPQPGVASQATPSSSPPAPELAERYQSLERDFQFLQSQITPLLQIQQQQLAAQNRPPKTLEEIQNDPASTPKDLVDYFQWMSDQRLAQVQAHTEQAALRAASTQRIRGLLTDDALGGPGRGYDPLTAKHLAPLMRQNPAIRQAVQAASPQDPALGEYLLATIAEISGRNGGDIVKTMKSIWNALDAEQRGAQEVASRITEAQRQQAQRVIPGSRPGVTQTRRIGASDWDRMSDAEFDRIDRRISGGM